MHTGHKPTLKEFAKHSGGSNPTNNCESAGNCVDAGHDALVFGESVDKTGIYGDRRIQASKVRALCADISDMTLWRWINERDFPKPIYIGRRRYWRESDVLGWLDAQAQSQ